MLEIQALTYNDLPPVVPISGIFPEEGGTIGRGVQNAIVLPDPMRLISRQHLQILPAAKGQYRLTNISEANLLHVNSEEVQPGSTCMVGFGDKVYVGGYVLLLSEHIPTISQAHSEPSSKVTSPVPNSSLHTNSTEEAGLTNELLAELLAEEGSARAQNACNFPAKNQSYGNPPPAPDSLESHMQLSTTRHQDPLTSLVHSEVDLTSLAGKGDELINSGDTTDRTLDLLQEPSNGGLIETMENSKEDPLDLFGSATSSSDIFEGLNVKTAATDSRRTVAVTSSINHGSELAGLFQPPEFTPENIGKTNTSAAPNPDLPDDFDDFLAPLASQKKIEPAISETALENCPEFDPSAEDPIAILLADAVPTIVSNEKPFSPLSTNKSALTNDVHTSLSSETIAPQDNTWPNTPIATPARPSECGVVGDTEQTLQSAVATTTLTAANTNPQAQAEDPLFQALLKGLGLSEIPERRQLDTNFMYLIGQLLRSTSQGTVDLMAGRAVIKREVKANMTLIAPERNNPLKFSPDGEVALMYLLGRTYPGFMEPAEAMNNAYMDLRAHQMGMMSGMRSALSHVLDKFNPANLDNDSIEKGLFSNLGNSRKAKLWDAYGHYYSTMRGEAEDHFQAFFGKAFLKAYEEATESLKQSEATQDNERRGK